MALELLPGDGLFAGLRRADTPDSAASADGDAADDASVYSASVYSTPTRRHTLEARVAEDCADVESVYGEIGSVYDGYEDVGSPEAVGVWEENVELRRKVEALERERDEALELVRRMQNLCRV